MTLVNVAPPVTTVLALATGHVGSVDDVPAVVQRKACALPTAGAVSGRTMSPML